MKIENISFLDFPLVIAVSGGVDSMVLLHLALSKISSKNIVVAHFNHNLRGEESDGDEEFVKNFCQKNNITFFSEKKDIWALAKSEKSSIEATARKYRYEFLAKICKKTKSNELLTAHHLDDRIETALFNLIRGTKFSGIYALRGSEYMTIWKNIIIIRRPLLSVSKSEILAFAKEKNIDFREDSTNSDNHFQRNFLRNEILPKFEKINTEYQKAIGNFIDYIETFAVSQNVRAVSWLTEQSEKFLQKREKFEQKTSQNIIWIFSISDFKNTDALLQYTILERLYKWSNNGNFGLSEALLDEILRFILEGKNSFWEKKIKNLHLQRRGDFVLIF